MIRIMFLGEVVGLSTVKQISKKLNEVIKKHKVDFTIANCDGASDGYGILKSTAYNLHDSGIKVITTGDYIFNKKDAKELLKLDFVLRPFNIPNALGGQGYSIFKINEKTKIGVISLLGRINFNKIYAMDPFYSVNKTLEKIYDEANIIVVDFHGGATSEIQAMHWYLAGKVSLVVGSHLRVLTSDNKIINNKTAVISGIGFCGGYWSIGGLYPEIEINKIKYGQFKYSKVEDTLIYLQGVLVDVEEETGEAKKIELLNERIS